MAGIGMQQQQMAQQASQFGASHGLATNAQRMQFNRDRLAAGGTQRDITGQQANSDWYANNRYQDAIGPNRQQSSSKSRNVGFGGSVGPGG